MENPTNTSQSARFVQQLPTPLSSDGPADPKYARLNVVESARTGDDYAAPYDSPRQRPQSPAPVVQINLDKLSTTKSAPLPSTLLSLSGQISVEDEDGGTVYGTEYNIGEDAWAAAIVAIVRNLTVISMKRGNHMPYGVNIARMVCSLTICVANLCLQFGLLVFIQYYLVGPAVHHTQSTYKQYLESVFDDNGRFDEDAWQDYEPKVEVCSLTMLRPRFYYVILLIWVLTQVMEIRHTQRLFSNIYELPVVERDPQMLRFVDTGSFSLGGKCHIVGATITVKVILMVLVVIPRAVVAFYLTELGCRWLTATHEVSDMILNSLALAFVTNIDELLYHSILPIATRNQIEVTKIFFFEGDQPKSLEQIERSEWAGYRRSTTYTLMAIAFLLSYGMVFQTVLPTNLGHLRRLCDGHDASLQEHICDVMAFMDHAQCYGSAHTANSDEL
eukprot:TRINITY_DN19054_c0_g1_i2.p1 TRINITY_DN19054_c0_g1~~TRINITY_DN19054_c0_g1_i2.p1  ORF type:complete len:445 (+),score=39.49 TRINITY_DN19054_c0_g1_i2:40-1374(+)